jgi:signal transduction histidine kinase
VARGLAADDHATASMAAMVGELLDLARLQRGQRLELDYRPVELVSLVRGEVEALQATRPGHRIRVDPAPAALHGAADPTRLTRVISNLLSNAVKYSPAGGDVTVSIEPCTLDGGPGAAVTMADRGLGIPAADLPHVFTPYYRAGNVGWIAGTGIGLAGARWIVEQHGGTLEVASTEGVGTTVTVRLPLAAPREAGTGSPPPR